MNKPAYIPERGDVIWIDLNPRAGHEQSGNRPALVLSPKKFNEKTGLAIICPITSKVKGLALEIRLRDGKIDGAVLPMHIRSVDTTTRRAQFIQKAPRAILNRAAQYVSLMIGEE